MTEFCERCEADTVVCQAEGRVFCSNVNCDDGRAFDWVEAFTRADGSTGTGNVCVQCLNEGKVARVVA